MTHIGAPLWRRTLRSAATASATLALLLIPPTGLGVFIGWPLPNTMPNQETVRNVLTRPATDQLLVNGLACVLWVLWFLFVLALLIELVAAARGQAAPTIPGLSPLQALAAGLVGAATIALLSGSSRSLSSPSPPARVADAASITAPTQSASDHPSSDSIRTSARQALQLQQTRTVRFAFDSAKLSATAEAALTQITTDIRRRADPSHPVTLVGHTDSVGPADYNQRLSVRRADTVRRALSQALEGRYRFQVTGEGETAPIADETRPDGGDNPAGRARNRRVEVTYTPAQSGGTPPGRLTPSRPTTPPRQDSHPPVTTPTTHPPRTPSSPHDGAGAASTPSKSSAPTPPPAAPSSPGTHRPPPISVHLPTGALVGLGLAAAISIAVAATRLHRNHRRVPDPDHLTVAEPEPASSPAVRTLRKAHLDTYTAAGKPLPSDVQLVDFGFTTEVPNHLTIGVRDDEPVTVPLSGLSVGLEGPGATNAARAIATELLTNAHRSRIELITPQRAATALFNSPGQDLAQLADTVPGLMIVPDLGTALRHLETEVLHRARMMSDHDASDVAALRVADPAEPLPTIMLIATADESERFTRTLQAILQLAERYGIGGLILGPWPTGTTCHVDTDGRVHNAEGTHAATWAHAQLFHLTATDAAELLQTIQTAHGDSQPIAPSPTETSTTQNGADEHPAHAPASLRPPNPKDEPTPRPVRIRLFGPISVETTDTKVTTGLRRISRDLLAFLAHHPEGATREQAIDAIWQDRDLTSGSTMFHTAVNNTRQTLRKATGLREPMFITYTAGRYHLDDTLIDVDLWHFLHALDAASHADNDPDRISALRRLADLYAGELADDLTYEWAERERERIRRTAIDALVRLAHLLQIDKPDDALTALEQAFGHDPTSEPLACDLMRLQAQLGHLDAVRRTHRLLAYRLNDLDLDPSPDTDRLLADLLHQRGRPSTTQPP